MKEDENQVTLKVRIADPETIREFQGKTVQRPTILLAESCNT
jgi:hypothetical protein